MLLSICGLFAGWGTSSSNYDQAWLQSLALCAGFVWGIENLHLTSMKPAVQSLTLFVLCSGLFDPCTSCTLDEELLKAECALCRSYSVALCKCRVPSHVWSFWHLFVSASKGSQLAMQLWPANWLKQEHPEKQRIWESNEGLGFVTADFSLVNAAHEEKHTLVKVRTSTFLSSLFLVFLRLVSAFLLFGFPIFAHFVSCSQWTEQVSCYQRSDCIQWVSVTVNAFLSSSWVRCAMYWWNWGKYLLCIYWNQPKVVLPTQCLSVSTIFPILMFLWQDFFSPTQYLNNEVYWLCLREAFCTYTKEFWRKNFEEIWGQKTCPGKVWCVTRVCMFPFIVVLDNCVHDG